MHIEKTLIIGAGIGGLTTAIALRRQGIPVDIIERDPDWTVYGVGIIQQMNVIRAMGQLDLLDAYLSKAAGFDQTTIFVGPNGVQDAQFSTPRLAGPDYPSNAGIRRVDLQSVLAERLDALGANVRLGLTVTEMNDDGDGVDVSFSDGSMGRYDLVIGADGVFSQTRQMILPEAPKPVYTGQWVWRYNLPMPADMDGIQIFAGPCNGGLVPMADGLMYMFLLSTQEDGFFLPTEGAAEAMRNCVKMAPPQLARLLPQITDDEGVVARPLETIFVQGDWHKGRVVLIGDAIHASTPHLAQGAGMAIEDGIVLAEELSHASTPEDAFTNYRNRRFARVKHVAENSIRIGDMQMGKIEPFDVGALTGQTIGIMSQPI